MADPLMNLNFGVGSFTIESFPAGVANDDGWEQRTKGLLESVPTIRDVSFDGIDAFDVPIGATGTEWEPDDHLLTPHPCGGSLQYRVTIPQRIQRELVDAVFPDSPLSGAESFFVLTRYRGFPVTWVFPETEATGPSLGSQDVMIVRMFLAREIERYRPDENIRFTSLAPSPFHCDFALRASDEDLPAPYKIEKAATSRGDEISVTYNSTTFPNAFLAIPAFSFALSSELSFLYESERRRERRLVAVADLQAATERLITPPGPGIWARSSNGFRVRRIGRWLSLQLIITDYELRSERRHEKSTWSVLSKRSSRLFGGEIEEVISETSFDDIENMNRIVDLVSSRQKRTIDISVLIATALITGLIGSLLAVLLSGSSH